MSSDSFEAPPDEGYRRSPECSSRFGVHEHLLVTSECAGLSAG